MDVKLVSRTLEVFELYSKVGAPLSLTELSRGLDVPMSSTLALVRTLTNKGYLYETRKRGGYYPTRRMLGLCQLIDETDPLLETLHAYLVALNQATSETVVLGKRQETSVIYLDAVQSAQAIHYSASPGELKPVFANSIGKALLTVMRPEELPNIVRKLEFSQMTGRTITTSKALLHDIEVSRERGWASNIGESFDDLAAIAMPLRLNGDWYGVSVVGPLLRMQAFWEAHISALKKSVAEMADAVSGEA